MKNRLLFTLIVLGYLGTLAARPLVFNPASIGFQPVVTGLNQPVFVTHAGDGSGRLFIVEKGGRIQVLQNGALLSTPFLDLSASINTVGEQGLLALAFHPDYANNGAFFVAYNDLAGQVTLARYSRSVSDPNLADPTSGQVLLAVAKNFSNHNGGTLAFGKDGYLYWSIGDGGGGGDPEGNGQDLTTLLGKLLRLDVDSGSPYAIPGTNPFFGSSDPSVRQEIWAYGLRNPWRLSFDRQTGDLYIGDVGQNQREEIDFQPASSPGGENYGWSVMEGSLCYNPATGCDTSGKILPLYEYDHTLGCSVTGGYVYRGLKYPAMTGRYFYADFCSGRVFTSGQVAADTAYMVTSFGEDEQGELYLTDIASGTLYQVQYIPTGGSNSRADYNGDGKDDAAVFRPSNGTWSMRDIGQTAWGASGDLPVPGNYDGDQTTDLAVFRPSTGSWHIQGIGEFFYGQATDAPVPADYNGDGATDLAFFRPSTSQWWIAGQTPITYGRAGDVPIFGDFNGDGREDIAVYRPQNSGWYVRGMNGVLFGQAGDLPVPADYNGDGITDLAVFRPSSGTWYIRNQTTVVFGQHNDIPIPADFNGDGKAEIAFYRPLENKWYVYNQGNWVFGMAGDIPLPRGTAPFRRAICLACK